MMETIQKVVNDGPKKFDIERINNFINSGLINNQQQNENSPHWFFPDGSLKDKVYGTRPEHFQTFVTLTQWTTEFLGRPASFWLNTMNNIFFKR